MKIGITINIGNYESLRLDTSELETLEACREELSKMIADFKDYIPNKKILEMGHIIETIKNVEEIPIETKATPETVELNPDTNKKYKISSKPCNTCEGPISWELRPQRTLPLHVKSDGTILGDGSCPKYKKKGEAKQ